MEKDVAGGGSRRWEKSRFLVTLPSGTSAGSGDNMERRDGGRQPCDTGAAR